MPAFGALVAEPLYVLVDTAVVGHLGTDELAGLGVASSVLLTSYFLFVFLAYGTTGAVARLSAQARTARPPARGCRGCGWRCSCRSSSGSVLAVAAPAIVDALGAEGAVRTNALIYLRISLLGTPALFVTMAGTGYLRGLQDTRTPLAVAVGTSVVNLVVQLVLIYGFDFGIGASAASTVLAQTGGAAVYLHRVTRSARSLGVALGPDWTSIRRLARVGRDLFIRTAALRGSLLVATAVVTRMGRAETSPRTRWRSRSGASSRCRSTPSRSPGRPSPVGPSAPATSLGARRAGRRMLQWGFCAGVAGGLARGRPPAVAGRRCSATIRRWSMLAGFLLWWVALLQPINGVVFVLDGLLMGAGDVRFLARAMVGAFVAFVAAAGVVLATGAGIGWLWAALGVLMTARLIPLWRRFDHGAWAVTGATR